MPESVPGWASVNNADRTTDGKSVLAIAENPSGTASVVEVEASGRYGVRYGLRETRMSASSGPSNRLTERCAAGTDDSGEYRLDGGELLSEVQSAR